MIDYNYFSDKIDLIIVGNGFDLANNFKTSYKDFVKSKYFSEILSNNDLAKRIQAKFEIQNWVDVEMEIAKHSNFLFEKYRGNIPNDINERFKKEFYELSGALNNFIIDAESNIIISNPYVEKLVEQWLDRLLQDKKKAFIISFNYLKYEYRFFSKNIFLQKMFVNGNPIPIHGTVSSFATNIVLGADEKNIKCKEHIFLLKSLNKNTDTKGYFSYIDKADRIILFGCSLGETDYRYYKPLFENSKNKKYEIYCYGDKEYLKIRNQINQYVGLEKDLFYEENEVTFYDSSNNDFPIIYTNKK